jgi:hypothetical protein
MATRIAGVNKLVRSIGDLVGVLGNDAIGNAVQ